MRIDIVSEHPDAYGRILRPYNIDGIATIGVFGNEEFFIQVSRDDYDRIGVRIAIDGTDVQTGKPANIHPHGNMWILETGENTMTLDAWPETNRRGSAFKFTHVEKSVAAHTHGNLAARGYISVAKFIDVYQPPAITYHSYQPGGFESGYGERDVVRGDDELKGPAVGAGRQKDQFIRSVPGLRKPVHIPPIVQLRYIWWDDLKEKLERSGFQPAVSHHPTGFDLGERPMANLGLTPREQRKISKQYSRYI